MSETSSSFKSTWRSFLLSRSGVSAVLFALTAPVVMLAIGGAYSYMTALQYRTEVQEAADAAALAATQAVIADPTANGTTVANAYLAANAPATATKYGTFTILAGNDSSVVTTQVTYTGTMPTAFSSLFGSNGMSIGVHSQAQGTATSSSSTTSNSNGAISGEFFANGPASGPGQPGSKTNSCVNTVVMCWSGGSQLWGDPHVYDADGSTYYIACTTPSGSWYNVLSDAGIEVNISCLKSIYYSSANYISAFSIMLGGHVIQMNAPPATYTTPSGPYTIDASTAWYGGITIDGTYYPPTVGTTSYLGGSVITKIKTLTSPYQGNDWVYIGNSHYSIAITFDGIAMGHIYMAAVNAGAQGSPEVPSQSVLKLA